MSTLCVKMLSNRAISENSKTPAHCRHSSEAFGYEIIALLLEVLIVIISFDKRPISHFTNTCNELENNLT